MIWRGSATERQQALRRGEPFDVELRARRKDGQYRWFLVRYNPLRDDEGRIIRWYATGIDIDDRKQAEERVQKENLALREEIDHSSMFEEIVGSSEALRKVLAQVAKVAPVDSTVLILGETGTGKELIARAIHKRSKRSSRAFIRVNCAAIPQSLIASELFGHEKGAFTGALQRRLGRFELADGGTIFLDEIGELPAETQIALLRVLQERELERVGSSQPISVDVRVLGRHQSRHQGCRGRRDVPPGSVLPAECLSHPDALACANGWMIFLCWSNISSSATPKRPERKSAIYASRHWSCFKPTIGLATFANCKMSLSGPSCCATAKHLPSTRPG